MKQIKLLKTFLILFYRDSLRGSEFVFDNIDSLYYKLHKITLNRGGSYIDSLKKATIIKKKLNKLKRIHKEYQKLNLSLISIIGKK